MRTGTSLKALLIVFATTVITACGGGDDSSDPVATPSPPPPPPPFAMTVDAPSEATDFSTVHVAVNLSGGSGTEDVQASIYSVGMTGGNPEITYTDTGFSIEIGAVAYSRENFRVTVT